MKYLKKFEDFEERVPITYWVALPYQSQLKRFEDSIFIDQDPSEWLQWKLNDFDSDAEVKRYRVGNNPDVECSITSKRHQRMTQNKEYWGIPDMNV